MLVRSRQNKSVTSGSLLIDLTYRGHNGGHIFFILSLSPYFCTLFRFLSNSTPIIGKTRNRRYSAWCMRNSSWWRIISSNRSLAFMIRHALFFVLNLDYSTSTGRTSKFDLTRHQVQYRSISCSSILGHEHFTGYLLIAADPYSDVFLYLIGLAPVMVNTHSSSFEHIGYSYTVADRRVSPVVYRLHPYVDSPPICWKNEDEQTSPVTYREILKVLAKTTEERSCNAHGISSILLEHILKPYWHSSVRAYNQSLTTTWIMPSKWKDARITVRAKKDYIGIPTATRPILLLDFFLKVMELLFFYRFPVVLNNRGILPDSQSSFRRKHT